MEDEELNEEVLGDPDNAREVTDELVHDNTDAGGDITPEEPKPDIHYAEMEELRQHISVLEEQINGLTDSISAMIESGATIMETTSPYVGADCNGDEHEPYVYLEDLDFTM